MGQDLEGRAVGEAFVEAIESLDFDRLEATLAPSIRFRALVPSSCRRASSSTDARRMIEGWFDGCDRIELELMRAEAIGDRLHVGYRLRVHDRGGDCYLLEQHGYGDVAGGKLTSLSVVCSGFLAVESLDDRAVSARR